MKLSTRADALCDSIMKKVDASSPSRAKSLQTGIAELKTYLKEAIRNRDAAEIKQLRDKLEKMEHELAEGDYN